MSLVDHPAFGRVSQHLARLGAGALTLYRAPYLERRLASRMRARRQQGLAEYAALLDADEAERDRLVTALAIGVTAFFRNPTAWQRLARLVADRPPGGELRGWSAGCASGEEAYSLAMILADVAERAAAGRPGGFGVDATDLDPASLAAARRGEYRAGAVAAVQAVGRLHHVEVTADRAVIRPELRSRVRFVHDDLTDSRMTGPYDVVVCRNVLIYFREEGQVRTVAALVRALAPGGLLMLGRTETVARSVEDQLEVVDARERIYRRVG